MGNGVDENVLLVSPLFVCLMVHQPISFKSDESQKSQRHSDAFILKKNISMNSESTHSSCLAEQLKVRRGNWDVLVKDTRGK